MDRYHWVVGWVTNDGALRSELRKVDLARDQVDLAKALLYPVGQSLNPVVGKHLGHSGSQHSRQIFELISQREVPRTSK